MVSPDHVRILPLSHGKQVWLGLRDDTLYVGGATGPRRESELIGLLPLLDRPLEAVTTDLARREADLSWSPGTLIERVPLAAVMEFALRSGSAHWAERALAWVPDLPRTEAVTSALTDLTQATWTTQKIRHRAKRLLRDRPEASQSSSG